MGQVNLRLSQTDFELLELMAKKKNIPVTSLFKLIIDDQLQKWKLESVIELHMKGEISFKKALQYTVLSPYEYIAAMESSELEPITSDVIENKSLEIALSLEKKSIFKSPNFKRKEKSIDEEIKSK